MESSQNLDRKLGSTRQVAFSILLIFFSATLFADEDAHTQSKQFESKFKSVDKELELMNRRTAELSKKVKHQNIIISNLEIKLSSTPTNDQKGMTFEVWTGILLACSALLLTIVAIGIALLSIFGYKKIVNTSTAAAEEIAKKVAMSTALDTTHEATTNELIRLLNNGDFNEIIREAVETISYRGIRSLSELDEQ
jgi:hypothetical protein